MRRAAELAERGVGFVNPNPAVGAVVVRDGRIIGEGWHERFGGPHAERNALGSCTENPAGATLYVTLEPCCHYGKTPPCTEAVVRYGIARVVVGLTDPNPLVAGRGIAALREAGVRVDCDVMAEELRERNRVFLKYVSTLRPWVALKTAMTLDGKIATRTGESRWITGPEARRCVHELRHRFMAVMVGIGTAVADDPLLNCRIEGRELRQPVRVVVDSRARLSVESRLVRTAREYRTIVACTAAAGRDRLRILEACGVEPFVCDSAGGWVGIADLLARLGRAGIDSVLLEGGGALNYAFLKEGLVDELYAFVAPKIMGGAEAKTPVEGEGAASMAEVAGLRFTETRRVGEDLLIRARCLPES